MFYYQRKGLGIDMEWTESLKRSIRFMEEHLLEDINAEDVAKAVHISSFYFQKGFKIMTDYTVGEYLRNRRLYLAALEVIADKEKIIDLAYKYGYENPESFTRAFTRFHGVTPSQLQNDHARIVPFWPLKIVVSIHGGSKMDYTVEKMESFKVIGFSREFTMDSSYAEIPKFWCEIAKEYFMGTSTKKENQDAVIRCCIGEYGVCIDVDFKDNKFKYMIAGRYDGGEIPKDMEVYEIPANTWAKFRCIGPTPEALQTVNTKIFKEWLPGNPDYEMAGGYNIEWYSKGDGNRADYESGIWVPVKAK